MRRNGTQSTFSFGSIRDKGNGARQLSEKMRESRFRVRSGLGVDCVDVELDEASDSSFSASRMRLEVEPGKRSTGPVQGRSQSRLHYSN